MKLWMSSELDNPPPRITNLDNVSWFNWSIVFHQFYGDFISLISEHVQFWNIYIGCPIYINIPLKF